MGVSRIVNTDFWNDEKVIDAFSAEDKYFWLYLLTNPHTRQLGVYKIPKKIMAFQLGYSLENVNVLIERFQNKYKTIKYSNKTQEIAILNYLKYSVIKGGKPVLDCIDKDIKLVKDKSLLGAVYRRMLGFEDGRETINIIIDKLSIYEIDNEDDIDNDIYIDNDNDSIVPRVVPRVVKTDKKNEINSIIEKTPEELQEPIREFVKMRKEIKKPLTPYALRLIIKKVNKLSNGELKTSIEILNQSIGNSWQGVFELKTPRQTNKIDWDNV